MRIENKKLMVAGIVAALLLSGCGKKPTALAAPIPFSDEVPMSAPDNSALEATQLPADDPYMTAASDTADTTVDATTPATEVAVVEDAAASSAADTALADAARIAKAKADADAVLAAAEKQKADDAAAAAKAEAAAKKKIEDDAKAADAAAKLLVDQTPVFKAVIGGDSSLHSAFGLAIKGNEAFVVDNARTGLLGKFAAVRVYDTATGSFKRSIENIGWAGAKNLPTSVNAVKLSGADVLASDGTTTWTFGADGALTSSAAGAISLVTEVEDAHTDDSYRIKGTKIERLHGSKSVVTFGDDSLVSPQAIAVDADGNIYVTEASGGIVVFTAPAE